MPTNENYREWIRYAEDDLESAKILASVYKPKIEISCYLCQQSAEKALKAFLIYHTIQHKLIHDLEKICSDCQEVDSSFSKLNNHCFVLTRYITHTRYPSSIEISEFDMKKAINYADEVLSFVKQKIEMSH